MFSKSNIIFVYCLPKYYTLFSLKKYYTLSFLKVSPKFSNDIKWMERHVYFHFIKVAQYKMM